MGYWVELIDRDTHQSINGTSANITFNLSDMFDALPCKSPHEWIGHPVGEILEKVDQSIKLLLASSKKYAQYEAQNGWGTVDGMRQFLTNVIDSWEPYTNVGQVNGNLDEKNSVEDPDDNGLTKLLLTEFNSKKITGNDGKEYLEIITPAVDCMNEHIYLYYSPEKKEVSDMGWIENVLVSLLEKSLLEKRSTDRNEKEKIRIKEERKIDEYIVKVAKKYECVLENDELKCKVRTTKVNFPIKTITLNAIIPMIQAETEIFAKLSEKIH